METESHWEAITLRFVEAIKNLPLQELLQRELFSIMPNETAIANAPMTKTWPLTFKEFINFTANIEPTKSFVAKLKQRTREMSTLVQKRGLLFGSHVLTIA